MALSGSQKGRGHQRGRGTVKTGVLLGDLPHLDELDGPEGGGRGGIAGGGGMGLRSTSKKIILVDKHIETHKRTSIVNAQPYFDQKTHHPLSRIKNFLAFGGLNFYPTHFRKKKFD